MSPFWQALHRWLGLAAGLPLALLGLSGSLMVWQAELDAALNPAWFQRPAGRCAASAAPLAHSLALLQQAARPVGQPLRPVLIVAPQAPGHSYQVWEARDPRSGLRREHFVDPDCGLYLGQRERGAWRLDAAHAVPLLYALHSRLMAGEPGHQLVGALGLVLLPLSLSGLLLAWPRRASRSAWRRLLSIRRDASTQRLVYDLHRAPGLWLLLPLLVLALTGAGLVYQGSLRAALQGRVALQALPKLAVAAAGGWQPAGLDAWVRQAQQRLPGARWSRVHLPAAAGAAWEIRLLQPGEPRADTGASRLRLDGQGRITAVYDPLHAPAANRLLDWLFPLHSGEALGLLLRCLWSLCGLLPALLLGSGLWLWWRRRRRAALAPRAGLSDAACAQGRS